MFISYLNVCIPLWRKVKIECEGNLKKPQFIGKIISHQWVEPNNNTDKRKLNILLRKVSFLQITKSRKEKNSIYDWLTICFSYRTLSNMCIECCQEYVNKKTKFEQCPHVNCNLLLGISSVQLKIVKHS